MRIIAGEARGRRLFAPDGLDTRPTTDRIRESVFGVLTPRLAQARVLDLFGGSGALSLEALSRGAAFAVVNDLGRAAIACIRRNVEMVGWQDRCRIISRDWQSALGLLSGERFDLVFLDPPYRMTEVYALAAARLREMRLLNEDAMLVMEHAAGNALTLPVGFTIRDERRYGDTAVAFVGMEEENAPTVSGQL